MSTCECEVSNTIAQYKFTMQYIEEFAILGFVYFENNWDKFDITKNK